MAVAVIVETRTRASLVGSSDWVFLCSNSGLGVRNYEKHHMWRGSCIDFAAWHPVRCNIEMIGKVAQFLMT